MKMHVELSEEMMRYVQSCLTQGKYDSTSALVETALREKLLHETDPEDDFTEEHARWEEYKRTDISIPHEEVERWMNSLPKS